MPKDNRSKHENWSSIGKMPCDRAREARQVENNVFGGWKCSTGWRS